MVVLPAALRSLGVLTGRWLRNAAASLTEAWSDGATRGELFPSAAVEQEGRLAEGGGGS